MKFFRILYNVVCKQNQFDYLFSVSSNNLLCILYISHKYIAKRVITLDHTIPTFTGLEMGRLLKTLWEKEKMLVTSIFSFSHYVFYPSQNKVQFFKSIYFVVCDKLSIRTSLNFCRLVKSSFISLKVAI